LSSVRTVRPFASASTRTTGCRSSPMRGAYPALRDPVDLEQVRPQLLVGQAGGDADQLAAVGDAVFGGDHGAVFEQRADVGLLLDLDRGHAEEERQAAH